MAKDVPPGEFDAPRLWFAREQPVLKRHDVALGGGTDTAIQSSGSSRQIWFDGNDASSMTVAEDEIRRLVHVQAYRFASRRPCAA
jgi:hypothetical protein